MEGKEGKEKIERCGGVMRGDVIPVGGEVVWGECAGEKGGE